MPVAGVTSTPPAAPRRSGVDERWAGVIPVAAAVAGGVVASTAIAATWHVAPYPLWVWVPLQFAGLSFTLSGAVLWLRRPANRTGMLMSAVGLTWYIGDLQLSDEPLLYAVGFCFYHLNYSVMGHLVLGLPDGRLHRVSERWLAVVLYVAPPFTQIARYVAEYPPQPQSWGNPNAVYSMWAAAGSIAMVVLVVVTVACVVRRWAAAGPPTRRAHTPMWGTVVVMGFALLASTIAELLDAAIVTRQYLQLSYALGMILSPMALVGGLLRVRMARGGVADLVVQLEQTSEPGHVRRAIAQALGDPALEVYFPLRDSDGHISSDGDLLPRLPTGRATSCVMRRGELLAVLVHDDALLDQRPLVDAVLAASRLALDNARLVAAQRRQLQELQASRARIVHAGDAERQRIQRDLHDGVQHRLLAVSMLIDQAARSSGGLEVTRPDGVMAAAAAELHEAIGELRALSEGIHPPVLVEQGLAAAVEVLAERAPVPVIAWTPARRWPEHLERAAYFLIAEALSNVYKHARASRAWVRVDGDAHRLTVEVADDGSGGADMAGGSGLRGLRDRVGALNGTVEIISPPGAGTRVIAEVPCG